MDYYVEHICSDDSNDGPCSQEFEAMLYNQIYHSNKKYDSNTNDHSPSFVNHKNKADRWKILSTAREPERLPIPMFSIDNHTTRRQDIIPRERVSYSSINEHHRMYNNSMQHSNYGQNYRHKPWNVQDRLWNSYFNNNSVNRSYNDPETNINCEILLGNMNSSSCNSLNNNLCAPNKIIKNSEPSNLHQDTDNSPVTQKFTNLEPSKLQQDTDNSQVTEKYTSSFNCNVTMTNNNDLQLNTSNVIVVDDSDTCEFTLIKKQNLEISDNLSNSLTTVSHTNTNGLEIFSSNKAPSPVKCNTSNTICLISDSDDDQSICEVPLIPKEPPPLIDVESSEEGEPVVKDESPETNGASNTGISVDTNEIIDPSTENSKPTNSLPPKQTKSLRGKPTNSMPGSSSKSKKKKKKLEFVEPIDPWPMQMSQSEFYNHSWGGENYDHVKIQQQMSANPKKWKTLNVDEFPVKMKRAVQCVGSNKRGHLIYQRPEYKKICCSICGKQGHKLHRCPNTLCLNCARPSTVLNDGCPSCLGLDHPEGCTSCGAGDHFAWLCPSVWRKFHSVTRKEDMLNKSTELMYKSKDNLSCCICTGRGHLAEVCPKYSTLPSFSQLKAKFGILSGRECYEFKRQRREAHARNKKLLKMREQRKKEEERIDQERRLTPFERVRLAEERRKRTQKKNPHELIRLEIRPPQRPRKDLMMMPKEDKRFLAMKKRCQGEWARNLRITGTPKMRY